MNWKIYFWIRVTCILVISIAFSFIAYTVIKHPEVPQYIRDIFLGLLCFLVSCSYIVFGLEDLRKEMENELSD